MAEGTKQKGEEEKGTWRPRSPNQFHDIKGNLKVLFLLSSCSVVLDEFSHFCIFFLFDTDLSIYLSYLERVILTLPITLVSENLITLTKFILTKSYKIGKSCYPQFTDKEERE